MSKPAMPVKAKLASLAKKPLTESQRMALAPFPVYSHPFTPTHYRVKDGFRVEVTGAETDDDNVEWVLYRHEDYNNVCKTWRTTRRSFDTYYAERDNGQTD